MPTERLAMRHVRDVIRMKAAGPTRFAESKLSRRSARDEHVIAQFTETLQAAAAIAARNVIASACVGGGSTSSAAVLVRLRDFHSLWLRFLLLVVY
jgi:hypothetical protein